MIQSVLKNHSIGKNQTCASVLISFVPPYYHTCVVCLPLSQHIEGGEMRYCDKPTYWDRMPWQAV